MSRQYPAKHGSTHRPGGSDEIKDLVVSTDASVTIDTSAGNYDLSTSGGSSGIEVTDGTTTVMGATALSITGAAVTNLGGGIAGVANDWRFISRVKSDSGGSAVSKLEFTSITRLYRHLMVVARVAYDDAGGGAGPINLKVSTNYTGGWNYQSFNNYVQDANGIASAPVVIPNMVVDYGSVATLGDAYGFGYFYFPFYTDGDWVPSFHWNGAAPDSTGVGPYGMNLLTGAANGGYNAGTDTFTNKITFDVSPGHFTYTSGPSILDLYASR